MRRRACIVLTSTTMAGWLGSSSLAHACQACYGISGSADSPMIDGARLGTFLLLGVTLAVQGSFVAFFLYLRRRAKRLSQDPINSEWSDLQRSPHVHG